MVIAIDLEEAAAMRLRALLESQGVPVRVLGTSEEIDGQPASASASRSPDAAPDSGSADAPVIFVAQANSDELAVAALSARAANSSVQPSQKPRLARGSTQFPDQRSRTAKTMPENGGTVADCMIGDSPAMREVRGYIGKAALVDSNVLITGETGTGKELVASLIHQKSARARRPMVCINCAAIPDSLLESELFGYECGAFTGAQVATEGKLEAARGGTVFLDEIGEMTSYAQSKLLRVTECREVNRLGGRKPVHLDIRIIAATNRELEALAQEDKFRMDLYFRLNVGRIHLPPLRERKSDIPALVHHYVGLFNQRFGAQITKIEDEVLDHLLDYSWPGNVRELKNMLESVYVSQPAEKITFADLPAWFCKRSAPTRPPRIEPKTESDRLLEALRESRWNKSAAAEKLNWSRMTLYRKLAKYHISGTAV
jgi:DNA-binding NtrC family response regulator